MTQTEEKNLLNSMKSQSLKSYLSSKPSDLFPHLKDLLIVLIVVKRINLLIVLIVVKNSIDQYVCIG